MIMSIMRPITLLLLLAAANAGAYAVPQFTRTYAKFHQSRYKCDAASQSCNLQPGGGREFFDTERDCLEACGYESQLYELGEPDEPPPPNGASGPSQRARSSSRLCALRWC